MTQRSAMTGSSEPLFRSRKLTRAPLAQSAKIRTNPSRCCALRVEKQHGAIGLSFTAFQRATNPVGRRFRAVFQACAA